MKLLTSPASRFKSSLTCKTIPGPAQSTSLSTRPLLLCHGQATSSPGTSCLSIFLWLLLPLLPLSSKSPPMKALGIFKGLMFTSSPSPGCLQHGYRRPPDSLTPFSPHFHPCSLPDCGPQLVHPSIPSIPPDSLVGENGEDFVHQAA